MSNNKNIIKLVESLSINYTKIISRYDLKKYKCLDWGNNGVGNRWANKKFNYTVIYHNGKTKTYSDNINDTINEMLLDKFVKNHSTNAIGIIGIFVHSLKLNTLYYPVSNKIKSIIKVQNCVSCGSYNNIICDHKNDLYNDKRVLSIKTQTVNDFQPLCNHCNLLKRQINKIERETNKLFSAKKLKKYEIIPFEFPWEKYHFDITNKNTKKESYWFSPVEFNNKLYKYSLYTYPIVNQIKNLNKKHPNLFI